MDDIRLINVKEEILSDNQNIAEEIREELRKKKVFMVNLMASPGAGKTSLLLATIDQLKENTRIAVIEGDIESLVDSEKIRSAGTKAVQLRTEGACHLDAPMVDAALQTLDLSAYDLIFIENIGNLVCPAEFDTGASRRTMILSVPEGDDKVLKYPLMFSVCDDLIINKIDCASYFDFDMERLRERVKALNPDIEIFEVSAKTGEGIAAWCDHLTAKIKDWKI